MGDEESKLTGAERALQLHLRERGCNFTQPRAIVVRHIRSRKGDFSAEELVAELSRGKDRVARGTVYRSLRVLEAGGLIRRLAGRGQRRYEYAYGRPAQDQLICEACGRPIVIAASDLRTAATRVCREHGFIPEACHVAILGICHACREEP